MRVIDLIDSFKFIFGKDQGTTSVVTMYSKVNYACNFIIIIILDFANINKRIEYNSA